MAEPLAYLNGEWIPASQLALPVYDAGFVQGVAVSEQLRTFGGKLFRLDQHLERLRHSLEIVGIDPLITLDDLAATAADLATRNHALLDPDDDLGLSLFITPGPYPTFAPPGAARPTVGLHTYPLPFHLWVEKYERGQKLVVTGVAQVPPECWPPELKCRSRMHYYLADRQAAIREPDARALMLDGDGGVIEASTANVVIYRHGEGFVSPPREKILPGVSVSVLAKLARSLGIAFVHRELRVADLVDADEAMLSSTSPCLLPVVSLNGRAIGAGRSGEQFRRLLDAWSDFVGLNIRGQAERFADRR